MKWRGTFFPKLLRGARQCLPMHKSVMAKLREKRGSPFIYIHTRAEANYMMNPIDFKDAYYIKLGKGGTWEESSIHDNKLRIGWAEWTLDEINEADWDILKLKHSGEYINKGRASTDINALRMFVESSSNDIWITFHKSQLWWCRIANLPVQQDNISKYRLSVASWSNIDIHGHILTANQIPGNIGKTQGFRGTICRVKETEDLKRLINDSPSESYISILDAKTKLELEMEKGISRLHWKDFETLVDLLFRNAGWQRVSVLGETMKYADLELLEPITGDCYQVQVKSEATASDFEQYIDSFPGEYFRKLYFVVHTPSKDLLNYRPSQDCSAELILPKRIARMVVELGLVEWIMKKIK